MRVNSGRGLLETPFISPWQTSYGFEDYNNSAFHFMKGVNKSNQDPIPSQDRLKVSKVNQKRVYSSRTRHQNRVVDKENKNFVWLDKGGLNHQNIVSPIKVASKYETGFEKGQWINGTIE